MMAKMVWLAVAGATGTLARYGLAGLVQNLSGATFPWGTAVVNIIGCFAAGLLWALFEHRITVAPDTRVIILIGFIVRVWIRIWIASTFCTGQPLSPAFVDRQLDLVGIGLVDGSFRPLAAHASWIR